MHEWLSKTTAGQVALLKYEHIWGDDKILGDFFNYNIVHVYCYFLYYRSERMREGVDCGTGHKYWNDGGGNAPTNFRG
jgi:hypothetical protein